MKRWSLVFTGLSLLLFILLPAWGVVKPKTGSFLRYDGQDFHKVAITIPNGLT